MKYVSFAVPGLTREEVTAVIVKIQGIRRRIQRAKVDGPKRNESEHSRCIKHAEKYLL